jgi:copper chaperone
MIQFHVPDMSCNHCVAAITQAVQAVDPGARVQADLAAHRVDVETARAAPEAVAAAIREAGYTPEPAAH